MKTIIYIGFALLAVGAVLVSLTVRKRISARWEIEASLLRLLRHLRVRVSCYAEGAEDSLRDYNDPLLLSLGFLPIDSGGLTSAFSRLKERCSLCAELDGIFTEYFKSFGEGYLDTELRKLDACIERVERILEDERIEGQRRGRVVSVVVAAAATCFALLMI